MNRQINLYEAKTQLSRLVDEAADGSTIIIAKDGKPMAKLGPLGTEGSKQPRKLGQLAHRAKDVDWTKWWENWKAADKEIEADFEAAGSKPFPSARPTQKKRRR